MSVSKDYSRLCDNHNPVFYRKLISFCLSVRSLFLQDKNVYIEITIIEKYVTTDYLYSPPPCIFTLLQTHSPLHICTYLYIFELRKNLEHFCSQRIFIFKPHKKVLFTTIDCLKVKQSEEILNSSSFRHNSNIPCVPVAFSALYSAGLNNEISKTEWHSERENRGKVRKTTWKKVGGFCVVFFFSFSFLVVCLF